MNVIRRNEMQDKGRSCELVKAWVVVENRRGDVFMNLFEDKNEAVKYAEELHPLDRKAITGIYETIAVELDGELLSVYRSDDIDGLYGGSLPDTMDGVVKGDYVSDEELEMIIKG